MTSRLLILACSARKRQDADWMPAIDRYNGPLWQTLRAIDPDSTRAACAFVSAFYGFGRASRPIQDYNVRMTPEIAAHMIEGGTDLSWPRPPTKKTPRTCGTYPSSEIAALTRYREQPFDDVAIVGGELYLGVMRAFVEIFKRSGHLTTSARVTEINAPIGYMRQLMTIWLKEGSHGISDRSRALHPDRTTDLFRDHPPISRAALSTHPNGAGISADVRLEDLKLGESL